MKLIRYVVSDSKDVKVGEQCPRLGSFPTEDRAARFISELDDAETGRYNLDGPCEFVVTEISNPAAVGWRWRGVDGGLMEVAWIRGTGCLLYNFQPTTGPNAGRWSTTIAMAKERWSVPEKTLKAARAKAVEFISA